MAFEFDDATKYAIRLRQQSLCALCGKPGIAQYHHIVPRQSGDVGNAQHAWLATAINGVGLCAFDHQAVHIGADAEFKIRYATGAIPPASYFEYAFGKPANSAQMQQWAAAHELKAETVWFDLAKRAAAKEALKKAILQEALKNADYIARYISQMKGEHEAQMRIITTVDTGSVAGIGRTLVGMAGYATTELFDKLPPLSIWLKAETYLITARRHLKEENLIQATVALTNARMFMMLAGIKYSRWKDGLDAAGTKMKATIVASAILIAVVTIAAMALAPAAVEFLQGLFTVTSTAGEAATPMVRLAATVMNAEAKFRVAEASIEELEAVVEAVEEASQTVR